MIVNTRELHTKALAYCLFTVEGGKSHNRSAGMWFFERGKRSIPKHDWMPWLNPGQAYDLLDYYGLCVWLDCDGWHAGKYGENDELSVFVDGATPALAICMAVLVASYGELLDLPDFVLEPEPEPAAKKPSKKARRRAAA